MNEDYKVMLENKKHEFKYYIRDVFTYEEIHDMQMFCDEIMREKEDNGYIDGYEGGAIDV